VSPALPMSPATMGRRGRMCYTHRPRAVYPPILYGIVPCVGALSWFWGFDVICRNWLWK
jgi:hypothetical protein